MKNITACQIAASGDQQNREKYTTPKQIPTHIAKAAWELWNSSNKLNYLLWETFSEDFIIIDEQMERELPDIPEEEEFPF
jgi:hypothetical protein